jgi:serine/threonine protein kinase
MHSAPTSRVGTPAYLAPEVINNRPGRSYDALVSSSCSGGWVRSGKRRRRTEKMPDQEVLPLSSAPSASSVRPAPACTAEGRRLVLWRAAVLHGGQPVPFSAPRGRAAAAGGAAASTVSPHADGRLCVPAQQALQVGCGCKAARPPPQTRMWDRADLCGSPQPAAGPFQGLAGLQAGLTSQPTAGCSGRAVCTVTSGRSQLTPVLPPPRPPPLRVRCSEPLQDLLRRILVVNPLQRYSVQVGSWWGGVVRTNRAHTSAVPFP